MAAGNQHQHLNYYYFYTPNIPPIKCNPTAMPASNVFHWIATNWLITDPALRLEEPTKNYHPKTPANTSHIYICGGRFKSSKQWPIHVLVFLGILAGGVLFWVFEASWQWHNVLPAVVIVFSYLWFLTLMFMVKTAGCDPGFAPRNIHVSYSPSVIREEGHQAPDEFHSTVSLPYFGTTKPTTVKYCVTCHIWRTPRMSHCHNCDSCVFVHDHHCVFMNNCVGLRNYRYFLWFLLLATLASIMLSVLGWVHVYHYRMVEDPAVRSFSASISKNPVSFLLALYGICAFIYPAMLLAFHMFLSANNLTTREYLNYVRTSRNEPEDERYVNVYNTHGMLRNLWNLWWAMPQGIALTNIRGAYKEGDLRHEPLKALEFE